ncbi:protein FAM114A2 [Trichogramma pretiosum]|uniref:protein FAM114A2 n=1 Tax=Trichogramma pretiosum TaxID=7493 RepID=UPI0006C98391|nr:protein FAM114A2 [Trichogramma pretiosum]XP_014238245.1 protein FAM114A2 [Trichogramma pretiosum]XP_014238246.1 protein FAM114A2 [Trichogramma pretiosum]
MSTSDSADDFDSADDKLAGAKKKLGSRSSKPLNRSIGSDSDDDCGYRAPDNMAYQTPTSKHYKIRDSPSQLSKTGGMPPGKTKMETDADNNKAVEKDTRNANNKVDQLSKDFKRKTKLRNPSESSDDMPQDGKSTVVKSAEKNSGAISRSKRTQEQRKLKESSSLGAKKLGAKKIDKLPEVNNKTPSKVINKQISNEGNTVMSLQQELDQCVEDKSGQEKVGSGRSDSEEPAELMSNLKFKDLFKPDGWENMKDNVEDLDKLAEDKFKPVLNKLASSVEEENSNSSWGGWGGWGVSSLINTATASVSSLTTHVSQGLSILEETIGVPDPVKLAETETYADDETKSVDAIEEDAVDKESSELPSEETKDNPIQYLPTSFGFGNFMSGVSTLTKLVESTSNKVIAGGLDTLEVIGKKTMEVLQEGDPGLKKKRALLSDPNKPNLSKILREAKEKADVEEKMLEEKNMAKRVRFESLFDDYQGLVHLEALEILSKECKMKIQTHLDNLDIDDLAYLQGVLEEVETLCDIENDNYDDDDDENKNKSLEQKLEESCKDLGIEINFSKLVDVWNDMNSELEDEKLTNREVFAKAIAGLARFTAYSVERFHKTAELLLIKKRRSTVNESDSLIQITKILSSQMVSISNLYSSKIDKNKVETPKFDIHVGLTTITKEANNAYSYIQEAFMLLIPIVQVGVL